VSYASSENVRLRQDIPEDRLRELFFHSQGSHLPIRDKLQFANSSHGIANLTGSIGKFPLHGWEETTCTQLHLVSFELEVRCTSSPHRSRLKVIFSYFALVQGAENDIQ
jgi:hypothetical protein